MSSRSITKAACGFGACHSKTGAGPAWLRRHFQESAYPLLQVGEDLVAAALVRVIDGVEPPRRGRDLIDTGIRADAKNGADAHHPQPPERVARLHQGKGCVPALGRVLEVRAELQVRGPVVAVADALHRVLGLLRAPRRVGWAFHGLRVHDALDDGLVGEAQKIKDFGPTASRCVHLPNANAVPRQEAKHVSNNHRTEVSVGQGGAEPVTSSHTSSIPPRVARPEKRHLSDGLRRLRERGARTFFGLIGTYRNLKEPCRKSIGNP